MEGTILDVLGFLENVDFGMLFKILLAGLGIFWLAIIGWVIYDASERFDSVYLKIFSALLVIVLPLFGLFIYMIIRPKVSREEQEWLDLERRYLKFEAAGLEDCTVCGYELLPNFIYCPRCGNQLRVKCESCDVFLEPGWRTCPFCGETQTSAATVVDTAVDAEPEIADGQLQTSVAEETVSREEPAEETVKIEEKEEKSKSRRGRSGRKKEPRIVKRGIGILRLNKGEKKSERALSGETASRSASGRQLPLHVRKLVLDMDGFVRYIGSLPLRLTGRSAPVSKPEKEGEETHA